MNTIELKPTREQSLAKIQEVSSWKTTDGEIHRNMDWAADYQFALDRAEAANEMLKEGFSVGQILEHFEWPVDDPILNDVTKDSKLVIWHWQCRDTPGYQPIRFNRDFTLYVAGDAGSWSGPYGDDVRLSCLVGYAKNKRSIL